MTTDTFYVLRIKENRRAPPAAATFWDDRHHHTFMRRFHPGKYLWWDDDPEVVEGDHGPPGPMPGWRTRSSVSSLTRYDSKKAALAAWQAQPVGDIVVEVVRVTINLKEV